MLSSRAKPCNSYISASEDPNQLTKQPPLPPQDFQALAGAADSKTAFYAALTRSLGGGRSRAGVRQAASWFYALQHSASPAGYSLLSRALNNATRWRPLLTTADYC